MPGTLFVVATPIGNLEDLTFRALRTLKEVDLIAAEDTRRTSKLLAHYEIRKPLVSVREHNEAKSAARLVERLAAGESIALVSDAGTPGIADPGARLVAAVRAAGLPVIAIPGASAVAAAISICGFDASEFVFMGFPPPGGTARADWFERLDAERRPVVFFEAPHRVDRLLVDLLTLAQRPICVIRELSKINEISVVRPNSNIGDSFGRTAGEFTVVAGPRVAENQPKPANDEVLAKFGYLTERGVFSESEALDLLAGHFGVTTKEVAKSIKKAKILVNQQTARP